MTKNTKTKMTKTKNTKTKTLILRRRVELRGRGVSRECRRPAQASVQAAVCRASQRVLTEWRGERAQARAGQLRPVSVHSVYCPQRLQHLPRPTYLAIGGLKRTASVMPLEAIELIIPTFGTVGYCEMVF